MTGYPLQYSCLENSLDRGVWRAIVLEVARLGHDGVANTLTATSFISKPLPVRPGSAG